jgi:hypothetical protein
MPDFYLLIRASLTVDYITARRARELYAEAESEPRSALVGDLDMGFSFWDVDPDSGLLLVHYRLVPLHAADVPTDTAPDTTLNPPEAG